MTFLLDNSVLIAFLLTVAFVGYREYKEYLRRTGMSTAHFRNILKIRLNIVGTGLLAKLITALVVASVISAVSFREVFLPDVFHTVFLTMLLVKPVFNKIKSVLEFLELK